MDDQVLSALASALAPYMDAGAHKSSGGYRAMGHGFKATGVPAENVYLYDEGGLFGQCDGPAQLINALVGPTGFEGALTWVGTDTEREFVDALTAVTSSGTEQLTGCGDCVKISLKACAQLYCFGRMCRQTEELQFDRIGLRANANVPIKVLFGNITDPGGNVLIRQGESITDAFMLQTRSVAYALRLKNATVLWSGNPENNAGAYAEYQGFSLIVNSGKYDAYTQADCNALDSFILSYGNNALTSDGNLAVNEYFRRVVLELSTRAGAAGLDWSSATMYIVMSPNMWDGVAKRYACGGMDLCNITNSSVNGMRGDMNQAQIRYEEYLSRMALPINGRWYPVVLDHQIPETTGQANGICSDIYFITTSISGETITFGQYQDFNMTYGRTRNELVSMFGSDDIAITDNGRFALVRSNVRGCFDVQVITKPRIVAKMPFLLGRITNVCHNVTGRPLPDTSGSGRIYEQAGGRTFGPVPTLYSDC